MHSYWLTSASAFCIVGLCATLVSACSRPSTWADELEATGRLQELQRFSPQTADEARSEIWKDEKDAKASDGQRHVPLFSREPAIAQVLVNTKWQLNLMGTGTGRSPSKLLNASRTKALNYFDGKELVMGLLTNAYAKPKEPLPCCGQSLLDQKHLFLVSVDPAILMVVPPSRDFARRMLDARLPVRGFGLHTDPSSAYLGQDGFAHLLDVFPDGANIEVVSDQWVGVRTLAEMEVDKAIPFKVMPSAEVPSFLKLILKDSGAAGK